MAEIKNQNINYPVYQLLDGRLMRLQQVPRNYNRFHWQLHHYVKQQQVRRNPELDKLQKLFFLPTQCHLDLHNCVRNFEEKWGITRQELLYGAKL